MVVIRRAAACGRARTIHLRDEPPAVVGAVTSLAERLHDLGLLSFSRYERPVQQLHVRVADGGVAFLTGEWLERWVAHRVEAALGRNGCDGKVTRNPVLGFGDGNRAEVDMVVTTESDRPFMVECRTGFYQDRLARDGRLRDLLGLPAHRAVVVLTAVDPEDCDDIAAMHRLAVTGPEELDATLDAALERRRRESVAQAGEVALPLLVDGTAPPAGGSDPAAGHHAASRPVGADVERIEALLREVGMRPHGEARPAGLAAIRDVLGVRPAGAREVREQAARRAGLSKSAVDDLLRALDRGGALTRADGGALEGLYSAPLVLRTLELDELERLCHRAWRAALRAHDPTLLGQHAGELAYRAATGAPT